MLNRIVELPITRENVSFFRGWPGSSTIKKLLINIGSLASAKVLAMAAQVLILPIMARYLAPEDFGVVALAMVFVTVSMTLSDAGLGSSLVRTQNDDPKVWSSAFWLILGIGAGFSLLLVLLAPLIASWFDNPEVEALLFALSPIPLIQSSIAVPLAKLQKKGEMALVSVSEVTATAISFTLGVGTAVGGFGVWALVVQQLVYWVVKAGMIGYGAGYRPTRIFSLSVLGGHLRFGRDTVAEAMVTQVSNQSANLLIGRFMGNGSLGIFSMAFRFIALPVQIISGPVVYVLYGYMARHQNRVGAVRNMFLASSRLVALMVIPPVVMISAASESFFTVLLSEKWADVGTVFSLMAPASAFMGVTILTQTVLLTMGETGLRLRLSIEMTVYWLVLLLISVRWGIDYVAAAYTFWYFSYLPRLITAVLNLVDGSLRDYVEVVFLPVLVSIAAFFAHGSIVTVLDLSGFWELVLILPELLFVWGVILVVGKKGFIKSIAQLRYLTRAGRV